MMSASCSLVPGSESKTISNSLACLLSEEGFADEPVGGCPVGASKIDPDQVGRIVKGVLAELKQRGLA